MGIIELFRTGFFSTLWTWSNPTLTAIMYSCVFVGFIVQIILRKTCKDPMMKNLLIGICGVAILICEGGSHAMTGWGRLNLMSIYGFIICVMFGATIPGAISVLKKKI